MTDPLAMCVHTAKTTMPPVPTTTWVLETGPSSYIYTKSCPWILQYIHTELTPAPLVSHKHLQPVCTQIVQDHISIEPGLLPLEPGVLLKISIALSLTIVP